MKAEHTARRVVVDSNIWISAALSVDGAPARVARRVLSNGLPVVTSETFAELEDRLWLPKFDRYLSLELRRRILHDLNAAAMWVDVPADIAAQSLCRDAGDDAFIHAALAAQAPWLVTGDRDLLEMTGIAGLRILSPADALNDAAFLPD
ncbi:MAG: putative toxin-antitoxin system toxin component, PIN family [Thermoflexales bacterium]